MTKINDLEKKRSGFIGKITRIQDKVVNWNANTITESALELEILSLSDLKIKVEDLYDQTAENCSVVEFQAHEPDFNTIITSIENLQVKVMELQREKGKVPPKPSLVKLYKIELPSFSGDYNQWQSFFDLFNSAVHKNPSLSGAEKFIYLKSALKGDAANMISSFQVTDANYKEAWESVIKRYDNKREIVYAHLKKFDSFPFMHEESASNLRALVDAINECSRSLKVLGVPVEHWDTMFIYLASKKLDTITKREWALEQDETLSTLKEFLEFIDDRSRSLMEISSTVSSKPKVSQRENKKPSKEHTYHTASSALSCLKCNENHHLHKCNVFGNLSVPERKELVSKQHLCFNCLFKGHPVSQCKMKFVCQKCGKKHHTLLHQEVQKEEIPSTLTIPPIDQPVVTSTHCTPLVESSNIVLMGTLLVTVDNSIGEKQNCRVFVDPGSEPHFISEQCVNSLGLKRRRTCVSISGIGANPSDTARGVVSLTLYSRFSDFSLNINALILKKITGMLPRVEINSSWPHLKNLNLSDPYFHRPGEIDILVGAQVAASLMVPGIVEGLAGSPVAQNTKFGWMLSGSIQQDLTVRPNFLKSFSHHVSCEGTPECIETTIQKFWKLEEAGFQDTATSVEDQECEEHFSSTYSRESSGSYVVELTFKKNAPLLGSSRQSAVKRFLKVENRLSQNPETKEKYVEIMKKSISVGHMELVPKQDLRKADFECYYMPHREVINESSTTTPVRIVYDASAKTSTGVSLNDILMTGPKLQDDLVSLLIRFRVNIIPIAADIAKMYWQTKVHPRHVDYQRLVWRESVNLPLKDYRLLRVTFGITSAAYLSIRCLHQLAEDEKELSPSAAKILKEDFLVDNLLSGSKDVKSGLKIQSDLLQMMAKGNLNLRKWSSSCREILEAVPKENQEGQLPIRIDTDESVKTIGILWQPNTDKFSISVVVPKDHQLSTKRKVLSSIARTFEPCGWLSPVTIKPKCLMQELWKSKLDWDSLLPDKFQRQWSKYCEELGLLKSIKIDRCITNPMQSSRDENEYELHGFCDASQVAYSACIYLRTIDFTKQSVVKLVIAKTKVAPIKLETIPRLELCGAVLLSKLMQIVYISAKIEFRVIMAWTDSTIVLGWLSSSEKLPVFVTNRVRNITTMVPRKKWGHVISSENPADPASRGISASALVNHSLWLQGPSWLSNTYFPKEVVVSMHSSAVELSSLSRFINKCSSFITLRRVVGYCLRFITNCRIPKEQRNIGVLTSDELGVALTKIINTVQSESFFKEIDCCKKQIIVKSNLKFLTPFLGESGILRVGGRLRHSSLEFERKHPILLPRKHNLTEQIMRHYHLVHLHDAPQMLLAVIRERFWIVRGPDAVKQFVNKCIVCHRQRPETARQLMGQLPMPRVTPSRPFSQCGVDYAGPFKLCVKAGRNPTLIKSFVSVFVCFSTRAIHLELVSDLSTAAFIAALTRFVSRRGLPSDIYCDGGKNFEGAKNEMYDFMKLIKSSPHNEKLSRFLSDKGIIYHFNPPLAPHHGGLWEAGVKSMKYHLKRIIEDRNLSMEEMYTLLSQVEACLNSRPLTPMSSDPNDFSVLTPGHFLVGNSLAAIPQHDLTDLKQNRLSRWQMVQQMNQHFWKRWSSEYLSRLQNRPKWFASLPNMKIGDLVLIRDDELDWGPMKWKLGRIVTVYPGKDGQVRVCDVKTSKGVVYKRPIVKLSLLPIDA